jgi:hypothetical protein
MSNDRKPVARITFRKDRQKYAIATIWSSQFAGNYGFSFDKPSEKYPAIGLFEALKSLASGVGFIDISVESQREQRGSGGQRNYGGDSSYDRPRGNGTGGPSHGGNSGGHGDSGDDFGGGGGDFGGSDDIPFDRVSRGIAQ